MCLCNDKVVFLFLLQTSLVSWEARHQTLTRLRERRGEILLIVSHSLSVLSIFISWWLWLVVAWQYCLCPDLLLSYWQFCIYYCRSAGNTCSLQSTKYFSEAKYLLSGLPYQDLAALCVGNGNIENLLHNLEFIHHPVSVPNYLLYFID